MQTDRIILDKKYVHKVKDENVFLCNLRRMLPLTIEKKIFETEIKNAVNEEEYWYLTCFYRPYVPARGEAGPESVSGCYAIRFLPSIHFLTMERYEGLLRDKTAAWERELLESLYVRGTDGQGEYYRLKDDIAEPFDNFLVSSLNVWDLFINYEERTLLSDVLEKTPLPGQRNVFLANMFVNTGHPFFFEHPNDHVPAIMLIETVRQFLLACSHQFGKVPFGDTQIIVNSMNARFLSYVNMNYPVLFRSTALSVKYNRHGFWKSQEVRAEVFQGARCLAEFTFTGNCIDSNLFRYIRESQIAELKQSRFIPLRHSSYRLEARAADSDRLAEATLLNLSLEGMAIRVKGGSFAGTDRFFEVTLTLNDGAKINGRYRVVWHSVGPEGTVYGLQSVAMGEKDLEGLYGLICRECIVEERREFS